LFKVSDKTLRIEFLLKKYLGYPEDAGVGYLGSPLLSLLFELKEKHFPSGKLKTLRPSFFLSFFPEAWVANTQLNQ